MLLFTAAPSRAESIRLAWDAVTSPSGVSYQIERGTKGGSYTHTINVPAGVTTYEVTGLTAGVRYYFVVRAVTSAGARSGPSNEVSAVAQGAATPPDSGGGSTPTTPPPTTPPPTTPPPTAPPPIKITGKTMHVTTEAGLQTAAGLVKSKSIITIAPGTYQLTRPLVLSGAFSNVEVRSATGRAADVVLLGPPATASDPRPAAIVATRITSLKLTDFSIRKAPGYAIVLGQGISKPIITGLSIQDDGEFIQAQRTDSGGIARGVIDTCTFEYTGKGTNFPVGVDIRGGNSWIIQRNTFTDPSPTATVTFGPTILAWQGSAATLVERNTFVNTTLEIVFGLDDRSPDQHSGGLIRNNMIVRKNKTGARGAAISLLDSPYTVVVNNTALLLNTSTVAIDYAHRDTRQVYIANNLLDRKITARDKATATIEGNYLSAVAKMFVGSTKGDLRLKPGTGKAAIDAGILTPYALTDYFGAERPSGGAVDVGAHEYRQ